MEKLVLRFANPQNITGKQFELFLGAPEIIAALNRTSSEKDSVRLQKTLQKYENRSTYRATPFGLFASCSVAEWGEETQIDLSIPLDYKISYGSKIIDKVTSILQHDKELVKKLSFRANHTIHEVNNQLRYLEYYYGNKIDSYKHYKISEIEKSDELIEIIKFSQDFVAFEELIQFIISISDGNYDEAEEFAFELISEQVLFSNISYSSIGINPLNKITQNFNSINVETSLIDTFKSYITEINKSNYESVFQGVKSELSTLLIDIKDSEILHATSFYSNSNFVLSDQIKKKIEDAIPFLHNLSLRKKPRNIFDEFVDKFQKTYESKSVSLVEVLDPTVGIYYPINQEIDEENPFYDLDTNITTSSSQLTGVKLPPFETYLLKKLIACISEGENEINLSEDDLNKHGIISSNAHLDFRNQLPLSYSFMGSLSLDNKIALRMLGGASGTYLITRFADDNEEMNQLIHEVIRKENNILNDKAILSEVNHISKGELGNILHHPSYLDYEIPIITVSEKPKEYLIEINDLDLVFSQGVLILYSKRLNKMVLPRTLNAFNHNAEKIPIYRFLCDYQNYFQQSDLSFSFGVLSNIFDCLPRVCYNDIILSPKTWKFKIDNSLFKDNNIQELRDWIKRNNIPSLFKLKVNSYGYFVINSDTEKDLFLFLDEMNRNETFIIEEFLEMSDIECISGRANEFISIHFNEDFKLPQLPNNLLPTIKREFSPGSEWIYFKIYGNIKYFEEEILQRISLFFEEKSEIKSFFFIRYDDEFGQHIRVRYNIDKEKYGLINGEITAFLNQFLQSKKISAYYPDIYKREIERYGEKTIEFCEKWFEYDSICTIKALSRKQFKDRWEFAILSIDRLLTDFQLSDENKVEFLYDLSNRFNAEFKVDTPLNQELNAKYRNYSARISELLSEGEIIWDKELNIRSSQSVNLIRDILKADQNPTTRILSSLVHMLMNRVFLMNQRRYEMIVYHFLHKHYKSSLARKIKNGDFGR